MKRVGAILLACVLLSACLFVPTDAVRYEMIDIRVVDQEGLPIRGAGIEARGGFTYGGRRAVDHTALDGTVRFRLPASIYLVSAHPPEGYHHLTASSGTSVEVDTRQGPASVTLVFGRTQ